MRRALVFMLLVACNAAPPPSPAASAPPATASALASASAGPLTPASSSSSSSSSSDAGASPGERALVAALRRDHRSLVACHRAASNAVGDVDLRVTIGVNGKVEAVTVEQPSTVPRGLEDCIIARVRAVRVELAPTTIGVPFQFRTSPYDGPTVRYGSGPFDPGY